MKRVMLTFFVLTSFVLTTEAQVYSTIRVDSLKDRLAVSSNLIHVFNPLRLRYDASNYVDFTVSSGGTLTIAPTGGFTLSPGGSVTLNNLTADRLVVTNSSKVLVNSISSVNLAASITDETGTDKAVFSANSALTGTTTGEILNFTGAGTFGGNLAVNGTALTSTSTTFSAWNSNVIAYNTLGAVNARGNIGTTAAWQSSDYNPRATGFAIGKPDNAIPGTADFRYLYVDEMHAKAFIADLELVLLNSQIVAKSASKIDSADFTVPTAGNSATLVVEEFAGFTGRVFQDGDVVRMRVFDRPSEPSFGGPLTIADAWGAVTFLYRNANNNPPTQAYTFTRSTGADSGSFSQASNPIKKGTLVIDYGVSGDGFWEVDNSTGKPFARTATWTTHPASGIKTRVKWGELGSGKYGILGRDATDANDVFRIDQDFARLANAYFTHEDIWAGNSSLSNVNTTFALEDLNTTTPTLSLGAQAASMAMTGGTGIYMDGAGNFRAATGAPITAGVRWTAASSLFEVYANGDAIITADASGATVGGWSATNERFTNGTSTTGLALNTSSTAFLSSTATGFEVWDAASPKFVIGVKNGLRLSWNHDVASGLFLGGNTAGWKVTATGLENTSSSSTITGGLIRTSSGSKRIEMRGTDNELEFFENGNSIVRIGSDVFSTFEGVNVSGGTIYSENDGTVGVSAIIGTTDLGSNTIVSVLPGIDAGLLGTYTGTSTLREAHALIASTQEGVNNASASIISKGIRAYAFGSPTSGTLVNVGIEAEAVNGTKNWAIKTKGGPILIQEISTSYATDTGTQVAMYMKNDRLIFRFFDGATTKFFYLTLSGTDGTWTYSTSEP